MSGGGACGKRWWYVEVCVGTGANWAKLCGNGRGEWSCCCQGPDVRASCRMSGTPDVRWTRGGCPGSGSGTNTMNSTGKIATPGAKFGRIGGWKSRERCGKARDNKGNSSKSKDKCFWGFVVVVTVATEK